MSVLTSSRAPILETPNRPERNAAAGLRILRVLPQDCTRPSLRAVLSVLVLALSVLGVSGCGGGWGEFKPTIATELANQTVVAGQKATFTVAATGTGPITYQWFKNGTAVATGGTGTTYS